MEQIIKQICLILITISILLFSFSVFKISNDYSRWVDDQTKFEVKNYTK